MHQPEQHREDRLDVQHDLIETRLQANGLPFLVQRDAGPFGRLQAHIARANPRWRELDGAEVLVVFQGPLNHVTPAFYETKREMGKVVPTWNYAMVQARGTARVRADTEWLDTRIAALTDRHEADRPEPWQVSDAPRPYIEAQLRGIVGIEIEIRSLEGKWKVSRNRPEGDCEGVAAGLAEVHPEIAALVPRYGTIGDDA